jgi:hypothetical protein
MVHICYYEKGPDVALGSRPVSISVLDGSMFRQFGCVCGTAFGQSTCKQAG